MPTARTASPGRCAAVLLAGLALILAAAVAPPGCAGRPFRLHPGASGRRCWAVPGDACRGGPAGAAGSAASGCAPAAGAAARRPRGPAGRSAAPADGDAGAGGPRAGRRERRCGDGHLAGPHRHGPRGASPGLPPRLVDVFAAALAGLATVTRHVRAMLRSREARRPDVGPWPSLLAAPAETVRGYGRLVAALLLRSLERAEALDRARRARGVGEP